MFRHTPDMGQISGFDDGTIDGKKYEKVCQQMLQAGVEWMLKQPLFEFAISGWQDCIGMVYADNESTQALLKAVIDASREGPGHPPEATGVQLHDCMLRLRFIHQNGWDAYVQARRQRPLTIIRRVEAPTDGTE